MSTPPDTHHLIATFLAAPSGSGGLAYRTIHSRVFVKPGATEDMVLAWAYEQAADSGVQPNDPILFYRLVPLTVPEEAE